MDRRAFITMMGGSILAAPLAAADAQEYKAQQTFSGSCQAIFS